MWSFPIQCNNLGSLSPAKVVECLLKNKAFVIKKVAPNHPDPSGLKKGQVTWSKFGGVDGAWIEAVQRSGFAG